MKKHMQILQVNYRPASQKIEDLYIADVGPQGCLHVHTAHEVFFVTFAALLLWCTTWSFP